MWREQHGENPQADFSEAEKHFTGALKEAPAAQNYLHRGEVRFHRAHSLEKDLSPDRAKRDYGAAADDYEEAIRLSPELSSRLAEGLAEARRKSLAAPR